ncbi:hypothetical protein [Acinetobacter sp.]|uniref:hypothetical protein n=1 Tax=Acinetobacter sp. TaxID=472 RepID=UPI0035B2A011
MSVLIFCGIGAICHAEQISFNGSIAEFTCTQQSQDQACQDVQKAMSKIKLQQVSDSYSAAQKQATKAANLSIESTEHQYKKVLVVNYN